MKRLEDTLATLAPAALELTRVRDARQTLTALLDALRFAPEAAEDADNGRQAELERERDHWFRIRESIRELEPVRHALSFSDAEEALAGQNALLPALEAELAPLDAALKTGQEALAQAEASWEELTTAAQRA